MIIFKGVSKSFNGELVISKKTIEFPQKGIVCIFGPSGVGKTTVFNLIAGLTYPDEGEVKITEDISMVFQENRLIPWLSAIENISLVLKDRELALKMAKEYMNDMQLTYIKNKRPQELSGGMKRRVAIARALAYDKRIMLMDEPFKGLEEELKNQIMDQVIKLAADKLIVIVTHEKADIEYLNADIVYLY
ncbi:ATP-binding cassette domain-containing protein [Clostridium sp.]|jgi:NitT/TauT family transport system ATP-binding protein|uniref:ATP-binding cassette domain-containing protein n=1 Tax=Clostridium sp. TaxID=1506 RepID=UPI003EEA44A1